MPVYYPRMPHYPRQAGSHNELYDRCAGAGHLAAVAMVQRGLTDRIMQAHRLRRRARQLPVSQRLHRPQAQGTLRHAVGGAGTQRAAARDGARKRGSAAAPIAASCGRPTSSSRRTRRMADGIARLRARRLRICASSSSRAHIRTAWRTCGRRAARRRSPARRVVLSVRHALGAEGPRVPRACDRRDQAGFSGPAPAASSAKDPRGRSWSA